MWSLEDGCIDDAVETGIWFLGVVSRESKTDKSLADDQTEEDDVAPSSLILLTRVGARLLFSSDLKLLQ